MEREGKGRVKRVKQDMGILCLGRIWIKDEC